MPMSDLNQLTHHPGTQTLRATTEGELLLIAGPDAPACGASLLSGLVARDSSGPSNDNSD